MKIRNVFAVTCIASLYHKVSFIHIVFNIFFPRFLRSVAYREFTRLIHGYLGYKKRIPLPACAYSCIRQTFKNNSDEENHKGFDMDLETAIEIPM